MMDGAFHSGELVVDNFAGGGGASTGIEAALGRPVDIAINHSPEAVAMHRVNHPSTRHYCEDVWEVDPREAQAVPVRLRLRAQNGVITWGIALLGADDVLRAAVDEAVARVADATGVPVFRGAPESDKA